MTERLREIYDSKRKNDGSTPADYRRRAAELAAGEKAQRFVNLTRMRSAQFEPPHRIRLWETYYGVRLPAQPNHAIVRFVAEATGLAIETVSEEQVRRAATRGG